MRNFTQLLAASLLVAGQVVYSLPTHTTAQNATLIASVGKTNIVLNTASPFAISAVVTKPNIELEMLIPLRAMQAEKARLAKVAVAEAAKLAASKKLASRRVVIPSKIVIVSSGALSQSQINFLGRCESGMTWNRNSGNSFYGAFQFTIPTWNAMQTGYPRADFAPIEVQMAAVQKLLSKSSIYTQFPGCARKMTSAGLI